MSAVPSDNPTASTASVIPADQASSAPSNLTISAPSQPSPPAATTRLSTSPIMRHFPFLTSTSSSGTTSPNTANAVASTSARPISTRRNSSLFTRVSRENASGRSTSPAREDNFNALHTTLSNASTIRGGSNSFEEDRGAQFMHNNSNSGNAENSAENAWNSSFSNTARGTRPARSTNTLLPRTRTDNLNSAVAQPTEKSAPVDPSARRPTSTNSRISLAQWMFQKGFLEGISSDVQIIAFGHLYRLHRIVLCSQSDYFNSLLTGGFAEQENFNEPIKLKFGAGMKRNAFEFCLANLYEGTLNLKLPVWAKTSTMYPMGEAFEELLLQAMSPNPLEMRFNKRFHLESTEEAQLATPDFLCSVLMMSDYLEMNGLSHQILSLIQRTITAWTVSDYLHFSLGRETESSEERNLACRGLESVGVPINEDYDYNHTLHDSAQFGGPLADKIGEACACWLTKFAVEIFKVEEWLADDKVNTQNVLHTLFGGQAIPPLRVFSSLPGGLTADWVRAIISSDALFIAANGGTAESNSTGVAHSGCCTDGEFERYIFARRVVEFRRREQSRYQTLSAHSSIHNLGEKSSAGAMTPSRQTSIYEMAGENLFSTTEPNSDTQTPAQLDTGMNALNVEIDEDEAKCTFDTSRRASFQSDKISQSIHSEKFEDLDELEFSKLFETGIHFSQMVYKQLDYISHDISPTSGEPFVPISVIQRAFWQSQQFKSRLPISTNTGGFSTHAHHAAGHISANTFDEAEFKSSLDLTFSINSKLNSRSKRSEPQQVFLVPRDDTIRINEGAPRADDAEDQELLRAEDAILPSNDANSKTLNKKTNSCNGPHNFFGIAHETRSGIAEGISKGVFGTAQEECMNRQFVLYEPVRVSVDFWSVAQLRERQRVYSNTFFYAGSFWNLYLQKAVKPSGSHQLGIYLHRQNPEESLPLPSQPPKNLEASPSPLSALYTSRATPTILPSLAPYRDKRIGVTAYFSIYCPSGLGTNLTAFTSCPDEFSLMQSFGYKSASLASEFLSENLGTINSEVPVGRLTSMRVTVVLGLV